MKTFQKLFLLTITTFFIFAISSCVKDKEITVTGIVTDANSNAVEGVTITTDGLVPNSTTTGVDGTYSILVSQNGTLSFSKAGYTTSTKEVESENVIDVILTLDPFAASFSSNGNEVTDPAFITNSIIPAGAFAATSSSTDSWFSVAAYQGAVDPASTMGNTWYDGWSFYSNIISGTTMSNAIPSKPSKTIDDAWMQAQGVGATINWVKDTTYVLSGFVFVDSAQTLNIAAGTVIQGMSGTGSSASALIIARNGIINATGTSTEPIIFTYEGDNGGTEANIRGQWGGLIILGNASLNSNPGETAVEGIPTNETRGLYGGSDDADNSGVLQYVSIRHGGTNIGSDNEINGLTLGAVGSGTTIEYVEIVGNQDDGVEWFGGTVNAKWVIAAYCGDDALDYDEGYRGKNQFVIVHQDPNNADRGGEHDGGTDPETAQPYATPVFYNATFVGNAGSRCLTFRDNAGGEYHNSIFTGFAKGIDIEDLEGQDQDSFKQWEDGNLKIENNVFFNIGAGSTGAELFTISN